MRTYLLNRFRSDADVLRQRAAALRSGPKQPGPDAATSLRMAAACDDVAAMIVAIPESDDVAALSASLMALIPLLEQRAGAVTNAPPLRAVYIGAATRIREITEAEARADNAAVAADLDDDEMDDIDDTADDADDDIDDDDLHDDTHDGDRVE